MAMSGTVTSSKVLNNYYVEITWSASYNLDTLQATITTSGRIVQSPSTSYPNRAYAIQNDSSVNYISVGGNVMFSAERGGSGSYSNPYHGYTHVGSGGADRTAQYPNWEGHANAYAYAYATLFTNRTFTVPINDDGYCSFNISGNLRLYSNSTAANYNMNIPQTTITTTPTDLYTKLGYKDSNGWNNNARIWYKTSSGWVKKSLYRKEGAGASGWVKK